MNMSVLQQSSVEAVLSSGKKGKMMEFPFGNHGNHESPW